MTPIPTVYICKFVDTHKITRTHKHVCIHSHRGREREFSVGPYISGGGRVSSDQLEQIRRMEGERVEPQLIGSKDVGSLSGQEHTHDYVWQESLLSTQPIQFPLHLSESLVMCPAFSTVY